MKKKKSKSIIDYIKIKMKEKTHLEYEISSRPSFSIYGVASMSEDAKSVINYRTLLSFVCGKSEKTK